MQIFSDRTDSQLVTILKKGGVGIVRTDTLYGFVAQADNRQAVERIFAIKGRDSHKPFIILISDLNMLYDAPHQAAKEYLSSVWPGPVSVILPSPSAPEWLRRGGSSIAYRLPANDELRQLIDQTGPLVAPSANPQGEMPAMTAEQAIGYFGDQVDAYVDGGGVDPNTPPSHLYAIDAEGNVERLR